MSGLQGPSVGDGCNGGGARAGGSCCRRRCFRGFGRRVQGAAFPGRQPAELGPVPRGLPAAAAPVCPAASAAAAGGILASEHSRGPSAAGGHPGPAASEPVLPPLPGPQRRATPGHTGCLSPGCPDQPARWSEWPGPSGPPGPELQQPGDTAGLCPADARSGCALAVSQLPL
uniref:PIDD1 alternative open reading frame protein n=1 Tax=Homo sapiens TaxID=9606 RepID=APDD1_HUMAN